MLVFFSLSWEFYWMLLLRYFTRWSTPEKPEGIFLWKNPSWQRTRLALAGKPIFYTAKVYRKPSHFRVEKRAIFTVFNLFLFMIKVHFSHSKFFSVYVLCLAKLISRTHFCEKKFPKSSSIFKLLTICLIKLNTFFTCQASLKLHLKNTHYPYFNFTLDGFG